VYALRIAKAALLVSALFGTARAAEVTFRYAPFEGENVTSVSLRGSMNDWGETAMTRQADGTWSITIDLPAGEHTYKYFINGQWPKNMEADHDGEPLDPDADRYVDDTYGGQNAVRVLGAGEPKKARATSPAPPLEEGRARIRYHRPDASYAGWGLHVWEDAEESVTWGTPLAPKGEDDYGPYWDVRLRPGAARVGFIVHKGDQKDPGPDMFLSLAEQGREIWLVSGSDAIHTKRPDIDVLDLGDLSREKAHWVSANTIVWRSAGRPGETYALHYSPDAALVLTAAGVTGGETIPLAFDAADLEAGIREKFPHLGRRGFLRIAEADLPKVPDILKCRIAVSATGSDGKLRDATGIQIPGVLDDLFFYEGPLGVSWDAGVPTLRVWAPTARSVRLRLYASPRGGEPSRTLPMTPEKGVWSLAGAPDWKGLYYLYEVEVFAPATGRIEKNLVTDPYSRSLSMNSERSQIVDMNDPALEPEGWRSLAKPPLAGPEDIVLYELHVRDFSASDPTVPAAHRGTFLAFAGEGAGARHLRSLAEAGVTHVHLLPAFDIATIDENRSAWKDPGDLSAYPPDSEEQQKAVSSVRDADGYNWGYDPFHFGVPEGSYATDPDGPVRILEFRRMVQALAGMGLRVVMDVVYNHTNASGQDPRSVFDRIVPGYYHRLSADGTVEKSTCCANTASEHAMMERFIADDLAHWAVDYKVDGFRFDLMGHHLRRNIEKAAARLASLAPEKDGVDGSTIYVYGEGWNFGEVADNKRGVNATQMNMHGSGVGTFNDRMRDAVRGGSPFGDPRDQGFATGLFLDPNGFNSAGPSEKEKLLDAADRIRIGLAGNLKDYRFVAHDGRETRGGDYASVGYARDPRETINYVSAHDNHTLFDKIVFAAPPRSSMDDLIRMRNLAVSFVALGQGVPFFHAGDEILRSKSFDTDSYNSGDWFNRLDFSCGTNNFGAGLPPTEKNRDRWGLIRPLLARTDLRPGKAAIEGAGTDFRELLRIRRSSPLFRLRTGAEVAERVRFLNTGNGQVPGLVVMCLSDTTAGKEIDPAFRNVVVLFNGSKDAATYRNDAWRDARFELHPVQATGKDPVVRASRFDPKDGAFSVPGRTTAVFVERR
jgi:pullulanase